MSRIWLPFGRYGSASRPAPLMFACRTSSMSIVVRFLPGWPTILFSLVVDAKSPPVLECRDIPPAAPPAPLDEATVAKSLVECRCPWCALPLQVDSSSRRALSSLRLSAHGYLWCLSSPSGRCRRMAEPCLSISFYPFPLSTKSIRTLPLLAAILRSSFYTKLWSPMQTS